MYHVVVPVKIGSEGLKSHLKNQISVHLRSVFQRLELIESEVRQPSESGERSPESVLSVLGQLERRLSQVESRFSSRQRDPVTVSSATTGPTAAAAAAAEGAMGLDEITREVGVYGKVLQVLSSEMNKLTEITQKFNDNRQQQMSHIESLQRRVSIVT